MKKTLTILVLWLAISAFSLLPAAIGFLFYVFTNGGFALACGPNINWSLLTLCIGVSYVVLSFSAGQIVWVATIYEWFAGKLIKALKS